MRSHRLARVILTLALSLPALQAQSLFKSKELTANVLVQAGARGRLGTDPVPGTGQFANRFSVGTSRLIFRGALESGFGYYLQYEFANVPAMLDTRISYEFDNRFGIDGGLFKTPVGREFLTPTEQTDFIDNASFVANAPRRDMGVQVRYTPLAGYHVNVGVFNGTGPTGGGDGTGFLYMARVSHLSGGGPSGDRFAWGASVGTDPGLPGGGSYRLVSADVRYEFSGFLLGAEVLGLETSPPIGPAVRDYGFHFTGGFTPSTNVMVLARYQRFFPYGQLVPLDDLIVGVSYTPAPQFVLSCNLVAAVKEPFPYDPPARALGQIQMFF